MTSRKRISAALIGLIALVIIGWFVRGYVAEPRPAVPGMRSGLPVEQLSTLPPEAGRSWQLIVSGGPFPYPGSDGAAPAMPEGAAGD